MNSLAFLVQEAFKRDPHGLRPHAFRGKSGKLIKNLWHDGLSVPLFAKRPERGRLWPLSANGVRSSPQARFGYLLEGIGGCRNTPGRRRRPADRWDLIDVTIGTPDTEPLVILIRQ
jgi:transposase